MEIGVCVKRVPMVGGKIVLTPDGQEVDTRMSGFAVSPHEECAVEEAVQITERLGGTVSVLTLGPPEAADQLRDALALGAKRAVLLETDGREWGPIATATAIVAEVRRHAADGPGYDLLLCGNEAADTGDYQVGIRVACALGWPCVTGIKNLEIAETDGRATARARREYGGGEETFEFGAARRDLCQGRHQPAPLPLAAGTAARQAGGDRAGRAAVARRGAAQAVPAGARDAAQAGHRAGHRGGCGARAPRRARRVGPAAMTVLCLVERDADGPADASLRALTFAARLAAEGPADRYGARPSRPCCSGPRTWFRATRWPRTGRPARTWSSPGTWTATHRAPGRRPWPAWPGRQGATAVVAAATDRGNEVLAYLGALTGLPMAANCIQAEPGGDGTHQVVRHRWAGLLLEEASLDGSPALMTVATEAVPATAAAEPVPAPCPCIRTPPA